MEEYQRIQSLCKKLEEMEEINFRAKAKKIKEDKKPKSNITCMFTRRPYEIR